MRRREISNGEANSQAIYTAAVIEGLGKAMAARQKSPASSGLTFVAGCAHFVSGAGFIFRPIFQRICRIRKATHVSVELI